MHLSEHVSAVLLNTVGAGPKVAQTLDVLHTGSLRRDTPVEFFLWQLTSPVRPQGFVFSVLIVGNCGNIIQFFQEGHMISTVFDWSVCRAAIEILRMTLQI
jgi:hypothetical protein